MSFFQHLKKKWNIKNNIDLCLIFAVFSFAGMASTWIRKPVFHMFGVTAHTPIYVKAAIYIPFLFPTYQVNLLIFGFLCGQFDFFLEKEKKLLGFLAKPFRRKSPSAG